MTPCQQSLPVKPPSTSPPPALSTLPSLFGRKLSRTLQNSFFFLFCSPPYISVPPSLHLYSSSSPPSTDRPPLHTSPPPPHLISTPRVTGHSSMGLPPPSPSSCLLPCLCFEAVCCGSTNARVRRKRRASLGTCMHAGPRAEAAREEKSRGILQSGRSGTSLEVRRSGSLPKVRRRCQERGSGLHRRRGGSALNILNHSMVCKHAKEKVVGTGFALPARQKICLSKH